MALTYNRNDNDIVPAAEFSLDAEAHIALAALQQEGIESFLDNEIFSRIYPIGGFASVRLMVKQRDLEKAQTIINSLNLQSL